MHERGFTVVEVMVAMLILVVGMLGTLTLVTTASTKTRETKAREGANNLARELVENARVVAYEKLTPAGVATTLQTRPEVADREPGGTWTIERRGIAYTVTTTACTYDDATDNVATTPPVDACASNPTAVQPAPARQEPNPDDFRRVDLTISWPAGSGTRQVRQEALIINPSGGLGPRLTSLVATKTNAPQVTFNREDAGTKIAFRATSQVASALRWSASDGVSEGDGVAEPGNAGWTFEWDLGAVGTPGAVVDGTYQVLAQAFNDLGVAGDQRAVDPVRVDRGAPAAPTGFAGGRNERVDGAVPPEGPVVELQWNASQERDIVGYRVYRTGATTDVLVCEVDEPPLRTSCYDKAPPATTAEYHVVAVDLDSTDADRLREGARSTLSVPPTSNDRPYFQDDDRELELDVVNGRVRLQWDPARDDDGSIAFYRVYRDGLTFAQHRHGRTGDANPVYDESEAATSSHSYWVTAVDDRFNESEPLFPRSSP